MYYIGILAIDHKHVLNVFSVQTPKKSQFSLKRKKSTKGGDEWSDFVCPMGQSGETHNAQTTITSASSTSASANLSNVVSL